MRKDTLMTFCLKVVLLLLILFGVDRLVGVAFVKMKDVGLEKNPQSMWLKTPYTVEKVKADIVVIGSSKASHNYIPDSIAKKIGLSVYNCGQDGCFFLFQNCIVNMILDRYNPKMIIWDMMPGSFTQSEVPREYQNARYLTPYYYHNSWAKNYIDGESEKMPLRMLSMMYGNNSRLLTSVFPLVTHSSPTEKGYIPLPSEGYAYPKMGSESTTDEMVSRSYLSYLDETLKRCKKKRVDICLYISPVYSRKNSLTQRAEDAIAEVARHNGVEFVNYHSDSEFMCDSTLFKDAFHLNERGAVKYTKKVCASIEL